MVAEVFLKCSTRETTKALLLLFVTRIMIANRDHGMIYSWSHIRSRRFIQNVNLSMMAKMDYYPIPCLVA